MFLKVSALGVGSVQNSNFTIGDVISVFMFENGINDFAAFFVITKCSDGRYFSGICLRSPYFFFDLAVIIVDYIISGINDILAGAVILFQLEGLQLRKIFAKIEYIFDCCATKGVNTLRVITHNAQVVLAIGIFDQLF